MLLILFLFPVPILQCLPMKKRTRFLWPFRLWVWFLFWWQRVLSLVPTSVLVSTSRRRAASASPPPSSRVTLESSAESSVDLQDNELDELQIQSDSPSPSRSPFLLLQSPILHLQSLLLQSPLFPASFKSVPASEKPVPVTAKSSGCLSTNWRVSRRSCSGYVVFECPDSQVFWDFGSLSRSIEEVYSTSFEYTIVSWNMFVVRFRGRKHLLCGVSLLFLKMLLTPCLLVGLLSSLDSNLFLSSIDPLLTYSTSSCCVNVFVASYFVYCLLVGEVRHVGELGGLVPPP